VDQFGDKGKRILIRNRPFVEISIILNRSEFPIFLFDEEEATCIGRLGSSDALEPQILVQELLLLLLLCWR
jgi:hypothetical protein